MSRPLIRILCFVSLVTSVAIGTSESVPVLASDAAPSPLIPTLRPVRVLLWAETSLVRVKCESGLSIGDGGEPGTRMRQADEWIDVRPVGADAIVAADQAYARSVAIAPTGESPLRLQTGGDGETVMELPGRLLVAVENGTLSVVNEVDIETYVACVTANEVAPDFDTEALRAQAIVSRTYVLYHMIRRPDAVHDVVATQGAQVYRGLRNDTIGRRAVEAADYTRGLVLTWRANGVDRLFCAYYSAACGGMSQSARPLGAEGDIPPLAGGVRCDYCRIAPGRNYRWGPAKIGIDEALSRLAARYPDFAAMGRISAISAVERTPSGRLVTLRIHGGGIARDILAERFRMVVGPNLMRSTDCSIRVVGDEIVFDQGKGYGHGLGMCQWGAQGQALQGRRANEILSFYFPGSRLTRVY